MAPIRVDKVFQKRSKSAGKPMLAFLYDDRLVKGIDPAKRVGSFEYQGVVDVDDGLKMFRQILELTAKKKLKNPSKKEGR